MKYFFIAALALAAAASLHAGPLGILGKDKEDGKNQVKSTFQSFSYDKTADWERLKKICVIQVETSQIPDSAAWRKCSASMLAQMTADLPGLAEYMKTAFCDEIKARSEKSWTLADTSDDETATLKLSITRLIPPADAFAPGDRNQNPGISFEGNLVDKKSGKTIMSFSETKNFTQAGNDPWYGDCKQIMKGWASSFAEMSMPDHEASQDHSRLRKAARIIGGHFALRKFMQ